MNQLPWPSDYGRLRTILVPNPAAGANFTQTVETNSIWLVLSVKFQIVASAVAASRYPHIVFSQAATELVRVEQSVATTAGQTKRHNFLHGRSISQGGGADETFTGLPTRYFLQEGDVISSAIINIDVGDQLSAIVIRVLEWLHVIV